MGRVSVITIVQNEEQNIGECLESVRWADERIVVDSGSVDRTVEVAQQHGADVMTVTWEGYGPTKNVALDHCTGDWILWLDADERVPPELAEEIRSIVDGDGNSEAGFEVGRRAYFLGRWIQHSGWYPGRVTRLFRKGKGRFNDSRVHEQLLLDGPVGSLKNDLLHFTDPNLHHYFTKFNRYTSLAAEQLHAGGRQFSLYDLLVRPPFQFLKMYILRRGFLDGMHGFVLATVSAWYVFTKYAKLWELQQTMNG